MQLIRDDLGRPSELRITGSRSFHLVIESHDTQKGFLYVGASNEDIEGLVVNSVAGMLVIHLPRTGLLLPGGSKNKSLNMNAGDVDLLSIQGDDPVIELKLILAPQIEIRFIAAGFDISINSPRLPLDQANYLEKEKIPEIRRKHEERAQSRRERAQERKQSKLARAKEKKQKANDKQAEADEAERQGKHEKASRKRSDAREAVVEAVNYELEAQQVFEELMQEAQAEIQEGEQKIRELQAQILQIRAKYGKK